MSLCYRNAKFQALNKDVISFLQHAPKQWHYCTLVRTERTVPLSSIVIVAGIENREQKEISAVHWGNKNLNFQHRKLICFVDIPLTKKVQAEQGGCSKIRTTQTKFQKKVS